MNKLRLTVIDVGWGDSLLLETRDDNNEWHYGLVDSNDTITLQSSHIFLKKFFEREGLNIPTPQPLFAWILLTHAHADHGQGLKRIMQDYGTQIFWYPKSRSTALFFTDLLRYAQKSKRVVHHEAVCDETLLPNFGNVSMQVLWPTYNLKPLNENNNSVVLALTLGNVCFVLTGDAEADVWQTIESQIPPNTEVFKVPHHGSENAMFDGTGQTLWLDRLDLVSPTAQLAISSHVRPFKHPSGIVLDELKRRNRKYRRTDEEYHITFETDGQDVTVKYSH